MYLTENKNHPCSKANLPADKLSGLMGSDHTYKEKEILDSLAEESGLAIAVVDENSHDISVSNNNSLCGILYASDEFAPHCDEYCGRAYEKATTAGGSIGYRCYAGLDCRAVPLRSGDKRLVAIVGRAFSKTETYRNATMRAIRGDWERFSSAELFENVLLTSSVSDLEKSVLKLEEANPFDQQKQKTSEHFVDKALQPGENIQKPAARRAFFGSIAKYDYRKACSLILEFLAERYQLSSLLWLERKNNKLESVAFYDSGGLQPGVIQISATGKSLLEAANNQTSVKLRQRNAADWDKTEAFEFFPVAVGKEIRCGLVARQNIDNADTKKHLAQFCHSIAPQLEILMLREEVVRRDRLAHAVGKFNESLKHIESEDFWSHVTQISAQLLQAERASILFHHEKTGRLRALASIGSRIDLSKEKNVGTRVARKILEKGKPLIVPDIRKIGLSSAPPDWQYRTGSFMSFPISVGTRRIAVLNFTDKAGGERFDVKDLELVQAIAPQIAVAIDHTTMKDRAGEFEQLSVTDALTGLLNRRYMEQRLTEEIKRWKRDGHGLSFMMIDVDEFKSYNDRFGHPAGDQALRIVGRVLKETLRGADVAARYGGEEFSVLLPQTACEEAAILAERIRQRIEETKFPNRKVTISIGIACSSNAINSSRDIISAADQALYEAKRLGRNKVQVFDEQHLPA